MNVSVISFTDRGQAVSREIVNSLPHAHITQYAKTEGFVPYESVRAFARRAMVSEDAIIFVGAAGIAVRAVAPFVRGKEIDPAVLVIDENARYVIPILSGHIGGANQLANRLAHHLHALPIITTATDGRGLFAADSWGVAHGCTVRNVDCIQFVSGALLRGENVGLQSDFPIDGELPPGIVADIHLQTGIQLSIFERDLVPFPYTLQLIPRIVHVGVGCRRDTPPEQLRRWAESILCAQRIARCAVQSVASIDLKADEPAVQMLAQAWGASTHFYTAQELEAVPGDFSPSAFVRKTTGTDNVCQRAAARASQNGCCLLEKTAHGGMTISLYCEEWRAVF